MVAMSELRAIARYHADMSTLQSSRRTDSPRAPDEITPELLSLRTRFDRRSGGRKRRLLTLLGRCTFGDVRQILVAHDLLLFVCANPGDAKTLRAAERALRRVAAQAEAVWQTGRQRDRRRLADSGIAGTELVCSLTYEAVRWLVGRYGRDVAIAWDAEGTNAALDGLLPLLVERAEQDGLLAADLSTADWLELARGRWTGATWLVEQFERLPLSDTLREPLFERLDLSLRWKLRRRDASRTWLRFPRGSRADYSPTPGRGFDVQALVRRPLPDVKRLPVAEATRWIDLARATLAVRGRETDAVTYADPREVTRVGLEGGLQVALFGSRPERRLPVESFFGYMAISHGVPIGYGGGWVFFDRCEIGVNVFPAFRGGPSAWVFAQLLRVYHRHYAVRRFRVDPYQFGAGNPEAIRSGAFWFYHRLGFRPTEARCASLAEREAQRIARQPGYRTPAATLRRLARSPLELIVGRRQPSPVLDLPRLGLAVTGWISREFGGDRAAARVSAVRRMRRLLCPLAEHRWRPEEREAFEQMCLLIAPLEGVGDWPAQDRAALAACMRAKGGPQERTYARRLQGLERLRAGWWAFADGQRR